MKYVWRFLFAVSLTYSRLIRKGSLNDRSSRLGWPLDVPVRRLLGRINGGGTAQAAGGWGHFTVWALTWKAGVSLLAYGHSLLSVPWWGMQCDQFPHALAALTSLPWWAMTPSPLSDFFQDILSQERNWDHVPSNSSLIRMCQFLHGAPV